MKVDVSNLINPIVGAAGAAISIGILADTARKVSNTMNKPTKYKRKQQRKLKFKTRNYWKI